MSKKEKEKTLSFYQETLWELCKKIIRAQYRLPDGTWQCFTSGRILTNPRDVHTGHFIPSSLCSVELRYDLRNLRIQSYNENINNSGNTLEFQDHLIRNHGRRYVTNLRKRNLKTKGLSYGKDWYVKKIAQYRDILEQMT